MNSLRTDGWEDAAAFLVMAMVAVYFWYTNDLYLNWPVVVVGIGAGVVIYKTYEIPDDHPVAGFPLTMTFVVVMVAALLTKSLVAGVVAALAVATAIKVYEVYLS
ncbi:hypothetical protein [Haladaptatus sp.]|uniref:hypothetical protein n=1 Tax=Haladaptatus sp. TaxID=1973141 RepID=UPI003C433DA9